MKFFAGTYSTLEASMLDRHREFVGCDVVFELQNAAKADLLLTFVSQMLSPQSGISTWGEMKTAAKVFKEESAALVAHKKGIVWEVPPRLKFTQVFLDYIPHFIFTTFENYFFYETCRHFLLNLWSLLWRSQLVSTDRKAHLAHECGPLEVSTRMVMVCHEKTGNRLFACRSFGAKRCG